MEIEEKIKNVDWKYLVNRREALLFRSFTTFCYEYFSEVTGIDWIEHFEFRPEADVLYSAHELGQLAEKIKSGGSELLYDFLERLTKEISKFEKVTDEMSIVDFSKSSSEELKVALDKYIESALRSHTFLLPMPIADQIIASNILLFLPKDVIDEKRQYWLNVLTYPLLENEHTKEERSFYQLVKSYKTKSEDFDSLLQTHLKNFSWIGARWYSWHNAWKADDVIDRLKEFLNQGKDPDQELEYLNQIREERVQEMEEIFQELKLSESEFSKLKEFVDLAKKYAFARTWRTDVVYSAGYKARKLFEEITTRAGFGLTDAQFMTFHELREVANGKKDIVTLEEIAKRREFHGSVFLDGQYIIFSGEEWRDKLKNLYSLGDETVTTELKGNSAFKGVVRGVAKVVQNTEDMQKVNRGDILIAVMTFPNLVPAMEKASAFVTDEGGILCHAAIISREMKKPCIIATKRATKVFKDGDMVEVDANTGIIRKI